MSDVTYEIDVDAALRDYRTAKIREGRILALRPNLTGRAEWKLRSDAEKRAQRWADRPAVHDRLAFRASFSEGAARVIWGRGIAWWRIPQKDYEPDTNYPTAVDDCMRQVNRVDACGVLKSELIWAHRMARIEDRQERGSLIGERSEVP